MADWNMINYDGAYWNIVDWIEYFAELLVMFFYVQYEAKQIFSTGSYLWKISVSLGCLNYMKFLLKWGIGVPLFIYGCRAIAFLSKIFGIGQ